MKRCISEVKRTEERSWLLDASHSVLQQSLPDLSQAFRNWWQGEGRVRAPNFKKRGNRQSIRACGKEFYPTETGVRFPKIGALRLRWSHPLPSEPSSVTIIKECSGKYYASFVVEVEDGKLPPTPKEVGIDLGLASLAVTSEGEKIAPPRFLRSATKKLRRLQRSLSRKVKGSRNRSKARLLMVKAHEKVGAKRLDFLHKLSTQHSAHRREPNGCAGGPECVRDAEESLSRQEYLGRWLADVQNSAGVQGRTLWP